MIMVTRKKYLLFATLPYAFPILRTLQAEILRRGGEPAWFLEEGCPDLLVSGERRLMTPQEVVAFDPIAVFSPCVMFPTFSPE